MGIIESEETIVTYSLKELFDKIDSKFNRLIGFVIAGFIGVIAVIFTLFADLVSAQKVVLP